MFSATIAMEWYGIGCLASIGTAFYLVRRVPAFFLCGTAILVAFIVLTGFSRPPEWYVMTAGLLASFAGLVIVRLMLMRSVSLRLLGRIGGADDRAFHDDLGARLHEMRTWRLVRGTDRGNALTPAGRIVAGAAAATYRACRIAR